MKNEKNYMGVFLYIKYGKFWSVSLGHSVEHKPLFSEECQIRESREVRETKILGYNYQGGKVLKGAIISTFKVTIEHEEGKVILHLPFLGIVKIEFLQLKLAINLSSSFCNYPYMYPSAPAYTF